VPIERAFVMGRIYKRGRSWYIDLYVKGRRVRKKMDRSKEIARLALKDAEVRAARDEFGFAKNDITVEKFFETFLEYSRTNHSVATTKRYRAVIDNFKAFLKEYPSVVFLSQIKPEHIDLYKAYRKDVLVNPNGKRVESEKKATEFIRKGARAKTINFEIDTLRTLFNLAIKWEYLKDNPTKSITRLKVSDSKPPRFLTVEECERFLSHCPDNLYPIYCRSSKGFDGAHQNIHSWVACLSIYSIFKLYRSHAFLIANWSCWDSVCEESGSSLSEISNNYSK
jgi:integrase